MCLQNVHDDPMSQNQQHNISTCQHKQLLINFINMCRQYWIYWLVEYQYMCIWLPQSIEMLQLITCYCEQGLLYINHYGYGYTCIYIEVNEIVFICYHFEQTYTLIFSNWIVVLLCSPNIGVSPFGCPSIWEACPANNLKTTVGILMKLGL